MTYHKTFNNVEAVNKKSSLSVGHNDRTTCMHSFTKSSHDYLNQCHGLMDIYKENGIGSEIRTLIYWESIQGWGTLECNVPKTHEEILSPYEEILSRGTHPISDESINKD